MPSATLAASSPRAAQSTLLPVGAVCEVIDGKTGIAYPATVLSRRWGSPSNSSSASADSDSVQYYVHRHDQDKRMDGWVDDSSVRPASGPASTLSSLDKKLNSTLHDPSTPHKGANGSTVSSSSAPHLVGKGKRKAELDLANEGSDGSRTPSVSRQQSPALLDRNASHRGRQKTAASSPSDTPALRNIDRVLYGNYDIKTWYRSPYPLDHDDEVPESSAAHVGSAHAIASGSSSKRHQSPLGVRTGASMAAANKRVARKDSMSSLGGALSTSARDAPAIKALTAAGAADAAGPSGRQLPASPSAATLRGKKELVPTKMLWICDGCFKYMKTYNGFAAHRKFCRNTHPPGRKVYQRGAHIIWEVDGAVEKLYCQNLSLFGKLFIDHKTIYFDVEPFLFYVLTDAATASFDHPLGFFSKEKISYDDYNLACIVTFPPFQRKSFGTLMIEFSYHLSAARGMLGTPERPLSDLGLKGYLSFWTAVLLRALICCFDGPLRRGSGARQPRPSSPSKLTDGGEGALDKAKAEDALRRWQILMQRCKLLGVPVEAVSHQAGFAELQQLAAEAEAPDAVAAGGHKRLRLKGWAGSVPRTRQTNGSAADARRSWRTAATEAIHPALKLSTLSDECTMVVTLESLSRLTHLRVDDILLALSEAGLVDTAPVLAATDEAVGSHVDQRASHVLLLTNTAVREAISRFNVRPAVLDESYALV